MDKRTTCLKIVWKRGSRGKVRGLDIKRGNFVGLAEREMTVRRTSTQRTNSICNRVEDCAAAQPRHLDDKLETALGVLVS